MNKFIQLVRRKQWSNLTIEQWGFTLIELIVVIAIIGILAAFLMANYVTVQQRARDAQRKSDIRQLQSALEIYRSDQGYYPSSLTSSGTCGSPLQNPAGTITYMTKVPCDPSSKVIYYYATDGSGSSTTYCLRACLENINDSQKDNPNNPSMSGCLGLSTCSTGQSFTVQNP